MRKWVIASVGLVVAAILAAPLVFLPSDHDLVVEALDEAVVAGREGRPGGVMEHLSRSIRYNNVPLEDRAAVAEFIRTGKPDVEVLHKEPSIQGDSATIFSPVRVDFRYGPLQVSQTVEDVRFEFRKETGTRWLVVPVPKWRLVSIEASSFEISMP
ncbi:MAG: hypothetical protein IT207_02485 [Fimbriimonadaceae bacterium]|nr:hypothetical protein [Fimbriimonadaceae bacterium]